LNEEQNVSMARKPKHRQKTEANVKPTRELLDQPWPLIGMHGRNPTVGGGWTVLTVGWGHDPKHQGGIDCRDVLAKGRRPIVRINNGYGGQGTLPLEEHYAPFAERVANGVRNSQGVDVFIIGNEWNTSWERPSRNAENDTPILPYQYAACYDMCRERIHALPGHEQDIVLFAPVGPWNPETKYPGNERGDWLKTYEDAQVAAKEIDGFAWHAYSRQQVSDRLARHFYMTSPGWGDHHWEFRVFEDWERATLAKYRDRYKFITEFDANEPWLDENRGFFSMATQQIYVWNRQRAEGTAPISAIVAYRWEFDKWVIKGKGNLIADYHEAVVAGFESPGQDPQFPPTTGNTWSLTGILTGPDGHRWRLRGEMIREEE